MKNKKIANLFYWIKKNKTWLFSGIGVFLLSITIIPSTGRNIAIKTISGNGNIISNGDNNKFIYKAAEKHTAIVDILRNVDVHLGDNILPGSFGTSYNPLHMTIYKQGIPGIIYYDKKNNNFLSDNDGPTLIGQALVNLIRQHIDGIDFSSYLWVRAYSPKDKEYKRLEKELDNDNRHKLGSTILRADVNVKGNFYERFAAVGIIRSISLISECLRNGVDVSKKGTISTTCIINCYHGGIRANQKENFYLLFNNYLKPIPSKTMNMRDPHEIIIEIPDEHVQLNKNNIIGIFVLPWVEEYPRLLLNDFYIKPAHFRDVGIISAQIQITQNNSL